MASDSPDAALAHRQRDIAFADAFDEGARVLMRLSARLRALHVGDGASTPRATSAAPTAADLPRARALGQRQLAVLGLGGLGDQLGLSASEVAKALGYSPANATNLLKRLEELEHLVRVSGERPARWRRVSAADG
ncbi:MarR family transcriptional regulator [Blastococcus sp. SYSU D00669]